MPQDGLGAYMWGYGDPTSFGSVPPQMQGRMDLSPIFGQQAGMAANMLAYPRLDKAAADRGYNLGPMYGSQNPYDVERAQQLLSDKMVAAKAAAGRDQVEIQRLFQGMSRTLGMEQTRALERRIATMAGDVTSFIPTAAMLAPDTLDALLGKRGSSSALAFGYASAGQFMRDPVTGARGLSRDTLDRTSGLLADELFGANDERLGDLKGLGGARLGQMLSELTRRGLMPGGGSIQELPKRIASRLQEFAGPRSAARDILADAGYGDVSEGESFGFMDMLTQGGTATMTPGRLEEELRRTQQLAKAAQIGMPGLLKRSAAAGATADSLGLDRRIAPQLVQGGIAFGLASIDTNNVGGFGAMSNEQLQAADQQLRGQAAASESANLLGAFSRLGSAGAFQEGSEAEAISQALANQQTSYIGPDGKDKQLGTMNRGDAIDLLKKAGLSDGEAAQAVFANSANQEFVQRDRIADLVRNVGQPQDLKLLAYSAAQNTGLSENGAIAAIETLTNLSGDERTDPAKRAAALARGIRGGLTDDQYKAFGNDDDERRQALRRKAETFYGNFGNLTQANGVTPQAALQLFDRRTQEATQARTLEGEADAAKSARRAGEVGDGPVRRLAEAIKTSPTGVSLLDGLLSALGFTKNGQQPVREQKISGKLEIDFKNGTGDLTGKSTDVADPKK